MEDFAVFLSARPTSTAYYPISVRQAAILLHAAFRRRLTATPLHSLILHLHQVG